MGDDFKVARRKDGSRAKAPPGWDGPKIEPRKGSLPDLLRDSEREIAALRKDKKALYNDTSITNFERKRELEKLNKEIEKIMAEMLKASREHHRAQRNARNGTRN